MMKIFSKFIIMMSLNFSVTFSFTIINGPEDTTVCMNVMAPCYCGFIGANPEVVTPNWRIVYRNSSGSVVSNYTIDGEDILLLPINGLKWVADFDSGIDNATNSKLLVGPVTMTLDQSSYQCMHTINGPDGSNTVMSSVGTMTVVDSPSVVINVDEICATSLNVSLNTTSDPACGELSHIVTISDNIIFPDGDSQYIIDGLESDALHNITVISRYNNNGSRIFNRSVKTSSPKSPYPIDTTSIIIKNASRNILRIIWKQPKFDRCSMLAIKHYDLMIYSGEVKINAETIPFEQNGYLATFPQEHFTNHLKATITINITVVDIIGQRSTTSSVTVTINDTQSQITSSGSTEERNNVESGAEADNNNDPKPILITIPIVAIVFIILVIIIIITILYLRYRRNNDKNLRIKTEENCYETQDDCKSQDLPSLYAVSGPTSAWSDSIDTNKNKITSVHEPSDHADDTVHDENIEEDESTPEVPPRLNYAEILLDNEVPKFMKTDNHVTYVETKPTYVDCEI